MKQYKATCPICNRSHEADKINDSFLDLVHHPECDAIKIGVSWNPVIEDRKFLT